MDEKKDEEAQMGITRQAYQSALNHFITAQLVTPIVVDVGIRREMVGGFFFFLY